MRSPLDRNILRYARLCLVIWALWPGGGFAAENIFSAVTRQDPLDSAGASARAVAMGTAFVGVADDSSSLLFNPAGLGGLKGSDLAVHHQAGLAGVSQDLVTLAMPGSWLVYRRYRRLRSAAPAAAGRATGG